MNQNSRVEVHHGGCRKKAARLQILQAANTARKKSHLFEPGCAGNSEVRQPHAEEVDQSKSTDWERRTNRWPERAATETSGSALRTPCQINQQAGIMLHIAKGTTAHRRRSVAVLAHGLCLSLPPFRVTENVQARGGGGAGGGGV